MQNTPFHALQRTDASGNSRWVHFVDPVREVEVFEAGKVLPVLRELEQAQKEGLHAVGWIAYEAAPGFDSKLCVHTLPEYTPLLRFTLYRKQVEGLPLRTAGECDLSPLEPELELENFRRAVSRIHEAIAAGEPYQVNFTYPLTGKFQGDAWSLFRRLRFAQSSGYQAYIEEKDRTLICASPERFFWHRDNLIYCKPMKGTAAPGEENLLATSPKNRAENIMIVDMIRNDLGKVADPGSVIADPLFEIERFPSLVQMTSTLRATGPTSPVDWLSVLFPCASITGAPKRKTMEWIHKLETGPRGVYTGCIGGFYADGVTEFNVAIRTATVHPDSGEFRYHTGCGIVWDSDPESEYRESVLKTAVLFHSPSDFRLIETMRGEPGMGIPRWESHRQRLLRSAAALGIEVDVREVEHKIHSLRFDESSRVRLTVSTASELAIEVTPVPPALQEMTFQVDTQATLSAHPELKHKTTRRDVYQSARERHPEADETLLINERGECIEFTIGNLVVVLNGCACTPPLNSGGLPGLTRAAGLVHQQLEERVLRVEDLERAEAIYLINSVRGWVPMRRVDS
ncbi:MAG: chorismate-binding protein [Kiritimatiellae bacterium]|jgi:para-aminobenzoate synthetase/4-amino-4-deoxychorismate lyase|nr:chorismate-binding protein [Kiritimatiellia bacterium]